MQAARVLVLALLLCTGGCIDSKLIANQMVKTGTLQDMNRAFFMEESSDHAAAAAPGLLKMMDGFVVASPENEALLLEAASLNCGYAMAFLDYSPDTASWAAAIYRKGRTYARRAVHEVLPGLDAALETSDLEAVRRELQAVGREDLKLVYWLGMCWGGRINATKSITDVADLPLVEALMQRALELDEGFFFAGAHLLFGMMYAGRTEAVGGDPARGRTHYERALELTGGRFLLGKVHYALNYAVSVQDPGLFIRLLEEVLAADPAEIDDDENRLVNQVSRDLATRLLDEVPLRFPDYRPAAAEEEEDEGAEDLEDLDLEDD